MKKTLLTILLILPWLALAQSPGSCAPPANIIVTNITTTSATVSWVSPPEVTSWEIEIIPATGVPTGVGIVATTNPFTFTGLVPGAYKVYIKSICPDGSGSVWPAPCIFTVPVCPVTDQCNYTFNLTDTNNDGWNGNSMNVVQNGTVVAVLTLSAGNSSTVMVPLCDAMPFQLLWNAGGAFPQEVGIQVVNANLQTVYSKPAGTGAQNTQLFQGQAQCMQDACYPPYNVVVTTLGTTATVSWAEAPTGVWQYYLVASPGEEPNANTVPSGTTTVNPVIINDIEPGADYTVYVRAVCTAMLGGTFTSEWSQPAYFTIGSGNYLTGNVSVDVNGDGICDSNDVAVPGIELVATIGTNAPISVYADNEGHYIIDNIAAGANVPVSINPVAPAGFDVLDPILNTFTFPANVAPEVNFCLPAPATIVNDIAVIQVPLNNAQAGFYVHYALIVQNNSVLQANNVTVTLDYNNNVVEVYFIDDAFVQTAVNVVTITVGNIAPLQTATTDVWFYILPPPANVGGEAVVFNSYAAMSVTDAVIGNNYYTLNQTVVNALDPNDITVHEGDMIPVEDAGKYLHYTIRFQNTGTAPAVNIRIENELDANLDWTTFDPIAASHNFTTTRTDSNMVNFAFNNIFLADSTTNEAASHGYVTYRIKPRADIAEGDIVNNTAGIFFDFNEPVITNTATSAFYQVLLAENYGLGSVVLYPNPVKDALYINALQSTLQSVDIYDTNGRLCITSGSVATIDTHILSAGMYLVKATTDKGTSTYKLIKQ